MSAASALQSSQGFFRTFELCYERPGFITPEKAGTTVPSIVCLAFSVELALKSVLLHDNRSSHGHSLWNLYSRLPTRLRSEIVARTSRTDQEFELELKSAANAFVQWRYIHEQTRMVGVSVGFLRELYVSVSSVASEAIYP